MAHLYPGHCVFCLTPFAPGQGHCKKCGLPPEGVKCRVCGIISQFDFCPRCGASLTPRAAAEIERLRQDPDAIAAFDALDEIGELLQLLDTAGGEPDTAAVGGTEQAEEASLPTDGLPQPGAPPSSVPASTEPAKGHPDLASLRAAAQAAKTATVKAQVREQAEQAAQAALSALWSRTYPTAQEARAAGTALQVTLRWRPVSQRLEVATWRCNAFNCEHPMPGGMSQCGDPSQGGVPILRVVTDVLEQSDEVMQYASTGSWRDSDRTVAAYIDGFLARLDTWADEYLRRLLDPADPLCHWLDTQAPGTADRVGGLRRLAPATLNSLPAKDWIAFALNRVKVTPGVDRVDPEDPWREQSWPSDGCDYYKIGQFLDGWWQVTQDDRFGAAALAWLAGRPRDGALHNVVLTLLLNQWQTTGRPLSDVLAICFAALPQPFSADAANVQVVATADALVCSSLVVIRDAAPEGDRELAAVDAATAFSVAAANARVDAPSWWDALLGQIAGTLLGTLGKAFARYENAPKVLAEVITRRSEMQRALADLGLPEMARLSEEDARRRTLEGKLAEAVAKSRDRRIAKLVAKKNKEVAEKNKRLDARHWKPLTRLEEDQPALIPESSIIAMLLMGSMACLDAAFLWARVLGNSSFEPKRDWPALLVLLLGCSLLGATGWRLGRRFGSFAGLVGVGAGLYLSNRFTDLPRAAVMRAAIGLAVVAWLGGCLWLRRRYARRVIAEIEHGPRPTPAEFRKEKAEIEAKERTDLNERWLMLHARLALAEDPAAVRVEEVLGETSLETA